MPIFDNFDRELNTHRWGDHYRRNLAEARRFAARVPLIHVISKRVPLAALLDTADLSIPTSDHPNYCGSNTTLLERRFNIPPSVYFFPGRVHPSHAADAVIAIAPLAEVWCPGAVTLTGVYGDLDQVHTLTMTPEEYFRRSTYPVEAGLYCCSPYPRWLQYLNHGWLRRTCRRIYDGVRKQFFARGIPPWRTALVEALAGYFETVHHWWSRSPGRPDPDGVYPFFAQQRRWAAWTFEYRTYLPMPLTNIEVWCGRPEVWNKMVAAAQTREAYSPARTVLDWLTSEGRYLEPLQDGEQFEYSLTIETWARRHCES